MPPRLETSQLLELHRQLCNGDRTASETLAELILEPLVEALSRRFPRTDDQIIWDGVVEAVNRDGEQFGTERLIELVRTNTFLTAEDIHALIVDQVFEWSGGTEQADDITVLCVKVV